MKARALENMCARVLEVRAKRFHATWASCAGCDGFASIWEWNPAAAAMHLGVRVHEWHTRVIDDYAVYGLCVGCADKTDAFTKRYKELSTRDWLLRRLK